MSKHPTTKKQGVNPRALLIGGFIVLVIALLAGSLWGNSRITSANPNNPRAVALGKEVYAAHCASCHGASLEGQPNWQQDLPTGGRPAPPHDETGHTWHHNDQSLFTTVKYSGQATAPQGYKSNMPAFGDVLSDEEIFAVLAYIKSTWPPDIQAAQLQGHQ
jgi:mono/diheme cytochrome c family protein